VMKQIEKKVGEKGYASEEEVEGFIKAIKK
jgi:hypothetical protein